MGKELTCKFFETALDICSVVMLSTIGAGLVGFVTGIANASNPAIDHVGIAEAEPYTLAIGFAIYIVALITKSINTNRKDKI